MSSGYNFPQGEGQYLENSSQQEQQGYLVPFDVNYQNNQGGYVANYSDPYYYNFEYNQQNLAPQDFPPLPASAPPPEVLNYEHVGDTQHQNAGFDPINTRTLTLQTKSILRNFSVRTIN